MSKKVHLIACHKESGKKAILGDYYRGELPGIGYEFVFSLAPGHPMTVVRVCQTLGVAVPYAVTDRSLIECSVSEEADIDALVGTHRWHAQ